MMKHIAIFLIWVLVSQSGISQEYDNYVLNELIVKFKPQLESNLNICLIQNKFQNKTLDSLNIIFQLEKIKLIGNRKDADTYILKFNTKQNIEELIRIYNSTGLFEYVEPNYIGSGAGKKGILQITPNDTYFSRQWAFYNDGSFSLSQAIFDADIDMELAWEIEQGDSSIIIAILDSGLKLNHPDINTRVWINNNETHNNIDDDENGFIDDVQGWDFANNDNDPTDDHGHGTNVAGIIGADENNNLGYAGVDWNSRLMVCKVLDDNSWGLYSWWTEAIYYAVDNGADIINMSVGGTGFSNTLQEAIDYAYNNGVIVVTSMMNEDNNVIYYPAGYSTTIAVGSTNPDDERSSPFFWSPTSGSNYGDHIDVVAPGNYIYGLHYNSDINFNTYWGGTSQATPLVTGLSALLLAQDNSRTPEDIRNIIRNTAEDQVGDPYEDIMGFDIYYGYGRINAHQALLQIVGFTDISNQSTGLYVYPNPCTGHILLRSYEIANVSIKNILGKEVYSKEVYSKEVESSNEISKIDVSVLPNGVYLVIAENRIGEIIICEKVIKN